MFGSLRSVENEGSQFESNNRVEKFSSILPQAASFFVQLHDGVSELRNHRSASKDCLLQELDRNSKVSEFHLRFGQTQESPCDVDVCLDAQSLGLFQQGPVLGELVHCYRYVAFP